MSIIKKQPFLLASVALLAVLILLGMENLTPRDSSKSKPLVGVELDDTVSTGNSFAHQADIPKQQNEILVASSSRQVLKIAYMRPEWTADFSDDKYAVGYASNVFVAKIIEKIGTSTRSELSPPRTQFSAEVIYNIKGSLSGTVIVNQAGGYKNDILYVTEGSMVQGDNDGGYLLQPGATYLLSTLGPDASGWFRPIGFPGVTEQLSYDKNLTKAELLSIVNSNKKVKRWEAVYPLEVVDPSYNFNSFESLPPLDKTAAQKRADAAKEWLALHQEQVAATSPTPVQLSAAQSRTVTPEVQQAINFAKSGTPVAYDTMLTLLNACKILRVVDVTGNTEPDYIHLHDYDKVVFLTDQVNLDAVKSTIADSKNGCVKATLTAQVPPGMPTKP